MLFFYNEINTSLERPIRCLLYLKDFNSVHHNMIKSRASKHQEPVVWKLAQPHTAAPRYIRGPVHDILVLHFKCQPLIPGRMFSSVKYEHFVQVSSNQTHIFIMLFDVLCGQESISKQPWYILPAVTHAFRRVRK